MVNYCISIVHTPRMYMLLGRQRIVGPTRPAIQLQAWAAFRERYGFVLRERCQADGKLFTELS